MTGSDFEVVIENGLCSSLDELVSLGFVLLVVHSAECGEIGSVDGTVIEVSDGVFAGDFISVNEVLQNRLLRNKVIGR